MREYISILSPHRRLTLNVHKFVSLTLVLLLSIFVCKNSNADVGFFGSYVGMTVNGTETHYNLTGAGGSLTDFHCIDFGDFTVGANSLMFTDAEGLTFKNSGGDVTGVFFNYSVVPTGSSHSFTESSVGFTSNATFTDVAGNTFSGGGDQQWSNPASFNPTDILSGLSMGDYEIQVFMRLSSNEGDRFHSNGGANYKASFSVVPEPTTLATFGMVMAVCFRRRRRPLKK